MDRPIALFAATMFVGALLLFWVQPLFGKMALPLLGGAPAVWNTAMVFFQFALLAGYAYADQLTRRLPVRVGLVVHAVLLLVAGLALPLTLQGGLPDPDAPVRGLLSILAASVGLPFFVLSATAPLVQRWFSLSGHPHGEDPYFLYSASNLGSILGLLGYPLVLAPLLRLEGQSKLWSLGFALLAVLLVVTGLWTVRRAGPGVPDPIPRTEATGWKRQLWWVGLAFAPSSLLLGVTTHVTTDLVAVPLLWVVPLALYLLTWVIAFARRPLVPHAWVVKSVPFVVAVAFLGVALFARRLPVTVQAAAHIGVFFWVALACHGELSRLRPPAAELTTFFLLTSLGGILGGAFNALLAPVLFDRALEYGLVFVLAMTLRPPAPARSRRQRILDLVLPLGVGLLLLLPRWLPGGAVAGAVSLVTLVAAAVLVATSGASRVRLTLAAVAAFGVIQLPSAPNDGLEVKYWRSFFGVYRVVLDPDVHVMLNHGTTLHGAAHLTPGDRCTPLAYYSEAGPLGQTFRSHRPGDRPLRVGVVGLGAGAAVTYARKGDTWTFYEIDPMVTHIARDEGLFPFLGECTHDAALEIIHGDARLRLDDGDAGPFDLLVLDAFSSDSIPAHLLTVEALTLYREHLAAGGLLAMHVSNRHLDLEGLVGLVAKEAGLVGRFQRHVPEPDADPELEISRWMVFARTEAELTGLDPRFGPIPEAKDIVPWTDDYSSLVSVLK